MAKIVDEDMVIAEDALIAEVQFAIHNLMAAKGISRADLARKLGASESHVSQLFKDSSRNLTLKTIARIFHVLGEEPRFSSETLDALMPKDTKAHGDVRQSHRSGWGSVISSAAMHSAWTGLIECNDNSVGACVVSA